MISTLIGLFSIYILIENSYCNEVEFKSGTTINLCCGLKRDPDNSLTIFKATMRLKSLYKNEVYDADYTSFQSANPGFSIENSEGDLCLKKSAAALADDKFVIVCSEIKGAMGSTLQKKEITIRVFDELRFSTVLPEQFNISMGESTTLDCGASGSPDLTVLWRNEKDGKLSSGSSSASLLIKEATYEMNGMKYTCEASTSIPKDKSVSVISQSITLNVLFKPKIEISMEMVHTDLDIEEIVNITVKGNPQPKLFCQLLDIKADRIMSISTLDRFTYVYQMTILNVSQKHIGNYKCMANNTIGEVTKYVELSLNPANVQITSPNFTSFSDYYKFIWTVNTKSAVRNTSITVETTVADNTSTMKTVLLTENEVTSIQISAGTQTNNWQRSFVYNMMNLTSNAQYKISVKVCNRHECIESKNPALFKTPITDEKNKFDPKYLQSIADAANPGGTSSNLKPTTLLFIITQSMSMLLLPLVLQQLY